MRYLLFFQSLFPKEWEVGAIIENEIAYNPHYDDCHSILFHVKYYKNLHNNMVIKSNILTKISKEDYIIIQIDAHSNKEYLTFRGDNSTEEDYISWKDLYVLRNKLYSYYGENILNILVSCLSAPYFQKIDSQHIIIAADNIVSLRRAEEQLLKFYNSFIEGRSYPTPIYRLARTWKGISFEEAVSYNSDNEMSIDVFLQDIDETIK